MSQTVVVRFRPLKLITCICGVIALILVIIAVAGVWLTTNEGLVQDSLWQSCEGDACIDPATRRENAHTALRGDWLNAVRAFAILCTLLTLTATFFRIYGWVRGGNHETCSRMVAMVMMAAAMVSIIIALIIFPVMTLKTLPYRIDTKWFFHWAYGVAWGGVIFMIGFIILLLIPEKWDQTEDTKYKDKIYYVNSGSQFETNA